MIKLPAKVKVGPYLYPVELKNDLNSDNGEALWGLFNADKVYVREGLSPERERTALLHELLHSMFEVGGIESADEEKIIVTLAPILFQVIKDNPKLMEYLK